MSRACLCFSAWSCPFTSRPSCGSQCLLQTALARASSSCIDKPCPMALRVEGDSIRHAAIATCHTSRTRTHPAPFSLVEGGIRDLNGAPPASSARAAILGMVALAGASAFARHGQRGKSQSCQQSRLLEQPSSCRFLFFAHYQLGRCAHGKAYAVWRSAGGSRRARIAKCQHVLRLQ